MSGRARWRCGWRRWGEERFLMSILNRIAEPDIYNHINFEIMAKIDKKTPASS
jgi:hypothetical protein